MRHNRLMKIAAALLMFGASFAGASDQMRLITDPSARNQTDADSFAGTFELLGIPVRRDAPRDCEDYREARHEADIHAVVLPVGFERRSAPGPVPEDSDPEVARFVFDLHSFLSVRRTPNHRVERTAVKPLGEFGRHQSAVAHPER